MSILKSLGKELIYGGQLISIGAVSVVVMAADLLGIKITWDFLLISYLWTHSVYLFNRIKEVDKDYVVEPKRSEYLKSRKKYVAFIIIIYVVSGVVIISVFAQKLALAFGFLLLLLSLLYTLFLKQFTKKITAFKNFFVSFVWVSIIFLLSFYYSYQINFSLALIIVFIFIKLFIHEELLNIRDKKADLRTGISTLAIELPEKKILIALQFLNFVSIIPIIIGIYYKILPFYSLALLLSIPYLFFCIRQASRVGESKIFLYDLFIDGELLFWSILILSCKAI